MFLPEPDASGIITFPDGFSVDWNRFVAVCHDAYRAIRDESHLHFHIDRTMQAPQLRFIPKEVKKGSYQHILWLFFTALTDRREVSWRVYKSGVSLYRAVRWIYGPGKNASKKAVKEYLEKLLEHEEVAVVINPYQMVLFDNNTAEQRDDLVQSLTEIFQSNDDVEEIVAISRNEKTAIEAILSEKKVGAPGQSARYWPRVAKTLYEEFSGDPIEIFNRFQTVEAFLEFKRDWSKKNGSDPFPGIGPKIFSLIAMFYAELGIIDMPEDAMPVDVHLQRFALATEIIQYHGEGRLTNEILEQKLRVLYCKVCRQFSWSHIEFSHAIWLLGRNLCTNCYKNAAPGSLCPVFESCLGPISSNSYFRRGVWEVVHLPKGKGNSAMSIA